MAIQDPAEMGMEKRLLLAMVLSMAVLLLFQLSRQPSPPHAEPAVEVEELTRQGPAPPEVAQAEPERLPETAETPITLAVRQSIEVESDDLVLRWSNAGGVLQSAQLKSYRTVDDLPLEIIPQQLPESASQAFGLRVGDEELDRRLREAVYEVSGVSGETIRAPAEITLHYQDARIEVTRKIRVPETGYLIEMETDVRTDGRSIPFSILLGPGIGEIAPADQGDFAEPKASYYLGGSVERHTAGDIGEEDIRFDAGTRWVGLESLFFAYLLLSPENIRGGSITQTEVSDPGDASATVSLLSIEVDLEGAARYAVFLGPKAYQVLQATDVTLSQLIDYGWFAFLVRPLLLSLNFIDQYLHNYGWAIIVLTFG
ncbi:MAG: membrane protein insertase YidC, partial [Anaerolineales bacterium]